MSGMPRANPIPKHMYIIMVRIYTHNVWLVEYIIYNLHLPEDSYGNALALLELLELCATWPTVTPPTLLELCRAWPAVTPSGACSLG